MCGILGIIGRSTADARALQGALDRLRHRGPDDEGYLLFEASSRGVFAGGGKDTNVQMSLPPVLSRDLPFDVALAHRRLSILDVSPAGHQPMATGNGRYWITFNGEIYNYVELRDELAQRGHAFRTGTDTEVLLTAYAEWGAGMLTRLIGMFAFAILDTQARTVLLARDPFGIKPLYWTRLGSAYAFASEIAPLLALQARRPTADVESLYQYMRFGLTDGSASTMFAGIHNFPPAHYAVLDVQGAELQPMQSYWEAGAVPRRNVSLDDAAHELRHLFDESVRLHLRSDVPLGSCLSGGLDSTAIVASMRAHLGDAAPIHAFSFISPDPRKNEGPYVDLASRVLNLEQHAVTPTADDLVADLDDLVRTQEQPFDSTSIYAQYTVFRLARRSGVTVMLDGQGSDELFGGYPTAVSAQLASALMRRDIPAIRALVTSSHMSSPGVRTRITLSALGRLLPMPLVSPFMTLVGEALYPQWLNAGWFRARGHQARPRPQGRGVESLRDELLHFVQRLSLPRLLRYEDRNSMAFSIESRVPFCNVALADFAFSLPSTRLVGWNGETKSVLRQAMRGRVPDAIIDRPKVGFETPERAWLTALRPWIRETVASDAFRGLPFIVHGVVDRVIDEQLQNERAIRPLTWRFLNVAAWARQYDVGFEA